MIRKFASVHFCLPLVVAFTCVQLLACEGSSTGTTGSGKKAAPVANDADRREKIDTAVQAAGALSVADAPGVVPVGDPRMSTVTKGDGTNWNCTAQDYNASVNADKLAIFNVNADTLYPGSMVQGKTVPTGALDPVPSKRASGTVTLALASSSGTKDSFSRDLKEVNLSLVTDAVNDILASYAGGSTPAKFSYTSSIVSSSNEVNFELGATLPLSAVTLNASLGFDHTSSKSHVVVKLIQEYFTMAFQPPYTAADFFDASVTDKVLSPYTGPGNPLVYINSVTYGRTFAYLFESDESATSFKAHIDAAFRLATANVSGNVDVGVENSLKNSSVSVFALGGNATDAAAAATGSIDDLVHFIASGASFGRDNAGVPISYSVRYVNDSSTVRVNLATEYTVNQCTAISNTQDIDLAVESIAAHATCNDGFWSSGCAGFYWTMKADVLASDGTLITSNTLASRSKGSAAQVCRGQKVTLSDDITLHAVPVKEGTCVKVYGQVWTDKDDQLVGAFNQLHCYRNSVWSPKGPRTAALDTGACGSNAADLSYEFTPL